MITGNIRIVYTTDELFHMTQNAYAQFVYIASRVKQYTVNDTIKSNNHNFFNLRVFCFKCSCCEHH